MYFFDVISVPPLYSECEILEMMKRNALRHIVFSGRGFILLISKHGAKLNIFIAFQLQ